MSGTTTTGRIFTVTTTGADITGFDPARDKLDLGGVSVHNFIVVDTPAGVGFLDPWSGETVVVVGVSLGQLTIDSFLPVENDHLRQCLSGALAWEHGVVAAPRTVYARSHEVGQVDKVAFNPATDVVDFRHYGSREQIHMTDGAEGVIISNAGTGQALILLGVSKAQLTVQNFIFYPAEVREDRVHLQLGFPSVPDSQVVPQGVPVVGTTAWPTAAGPGAPPSGATGTTFAVDWDHGVHAMLDFDPATDRLDFGWFKPQEISIAEVAGSTVVTIEGNRQSYTLTGVGLGEMTMANIVARDPGTRAEWQAALEAAPPAATLPSLAVADAEGVEGDAGARSLVFAVTLSAAATTTVTVDVTTLDGTARAGSDYAAAATTLTFAPGQTRQTFSVGILDDTVTELTETLRAQLSNARGATLRDATAIGTIRDDDLDSAPATPPTISIADYATEEGDAELTHMRIPVTLSKATTETVTVRYRTADVTGTADVDYERLDGILTFAPGETRQTIHAHINGDTAFEPTESYRILLSAPVGATIADGDGLVTITNDDAATPAGGTGLDYRVDNDWGAGFTATITVDAGATALNGWTASFEADFTISNIWNAVIVSHVGDRYVIRNKSYNGNVPAGGETSFGFQAAGGPANSLSGLALDGIGAAVPPSLAVADAGMAEGAGSGTLSFAVSLSAPASGPVTVAYRTADGTATAGSDYVATAGTLTFAAGETMKTVRVAVLGDTRAEANETLRLELLAPNGATIRDGSAIGTLLNDDAAQATPPRIRIADASVVEGAGGQGGWLSTAGNQIVDATGDAVRIAGVNWFGFEGTNMSPNGLWTRGYKEMMAQMVELGFNTIRLPFSGDMLRATGPALGIDGSKNPDLVGLTPLQVMDRIVDHAQEIGLRIILDHHRPDAGAGTSANGLWYDAAHPESQWIEGWRMLAARYADNPAVIGADLHNEPHNGTWGGGGPKDWAAAAERAGNAIGAVNPNWLIFVEGVAVHRGENYWWGGNLMGVRDRPIALDVPNKLVYSAHDYPNSIYEQPWFQGADFPGNLPAKFDQMWGYIFREGIAPVYIGEFGTKLVDPKDAPWLEAITSYLGGDFDNDGRNDLAPGQEGISWTYWSWNPNSGDTGGILKDDWRSVHDNKLAYLNPIRAELLPANEDGGPAQLLFEVTLSAPATAPVTVAYRTTTDTADGDDAAAASGILTFASGEQSKTIRIVVDDDALREGNERIRLLLSDPTGATIADGTALGTIIDDDGIVRATTADGTRATLRLLQGSGGADHMEGGETMLVGRGGQDTLLGGEGADIFRWNTAWEGRDRVGGFTPGEDLLWIDASGFGGGLVAGMDLAAAGRFVAGAAATAARGQLLYDRATGALSWDADGTGAGTASLIATFDPGTALAARDVAIIA